MTTVKQKKELDIVKLLREMAYELHDGQFRRDGVTPYIDHVADVAYRVRNAGDMTIALAWGHDLIEDKRVTRHEMIARGVPAGMMMYFEMLAFPSGLTLDEYLQRVAQLAPFSAVRDVKIADNMSNLSDSPTAKQIAKYTASLDILMSYAMKEYTGSHKLCCK